MTQPNQGSEDWLKERAGKFTGSKFVDVMARSKKTGEPLKAYFDLIWQIVAERLTGEPTEQVTAKSLQWGNDIEPYAREAYELETGCFVEQSGFLLHPDYEYAGCSPDGLVGNDGIIEMKCPKSPTIHLERFLSGVPDEYMPQIQGNLWVTNRNWCDFVSYDPRMPEQYRLLIKRVNRDDIYIKHLEQYVIEAESKVNELINQLKVAA